MGGWYRGPGFWVATPFRRTLWVCFCGMNTLVQISEVGPDDGKELQLSDRQDSFTVTRLLDDAKNSGTVGKPVAVERIEYVDSGRKSVTGARVFVRVDAKKVGG